MIRDYDKARRLFDNIRGAMDKISQTNEKYWDDIKTTQVVMKGMPLDNPDYRERFYISRKKAFDEISIALYKFGFRQCKYTGDLKAPAFNDIDSIICMRKHGYDFSYHHGNLMMTEIPERYVKQGS